MAVCQQELDQFFLKLRRAASRAQSLRKKRLEYERTCEARSQTRPRSVAAASRSEHAKAKPHRIARTATRTCLAKGLLEATVDMPTIVSMERTASLRWKKPSVAPMINYRRSEALTGAADNESWCCSQDYLDLCRRSGESCETGKEGFCKLDVAEADTTASEESDTDLCAARPRLGSEESCGTPVHDGITKAEEASVQSRGAFEEATEGAQDEEEAARVPSASAVLAPEEQPPLPRAQTRREEVLCNLVRHLRTQAVEEQKRAGAAEAEKLALEATPKQAQQPRTAELRTVALKCERQRAASMRKRRHQESEISALKRKADRALKDALAAKELAEAEAIAEHARHLAQADIAAREEAEAIAATEIAKAQADADELVQQRLAEIEDLEATTRARAQAEAEAMRAQAESEAAASKAKAEEARTKVQAEAQALKFRAEVEARVIRARAELEARELQAEVEAKRQEEQGMHCDAVVAIQTTQGEQKPAQVAARRESAAAALRRAKSLQQQQAKQHRRRAEEERRREQLQEQELRECRAKAEEEARAVKAQALAAVEAMKVKAREEAQVARARVEAEARRNAEQEMAAMRAAAEATARDITARAEEHAQALRAQVEREQSQAMEELEAMKAGAAAQSVVASEVASNEDGQQEHTAEVDWEVLLDGAADLSAEAEAAGWSVIA